MKLLRTDNSLRRIVNGNKGRRIGKRESRVGDENEKKQERERRKFRET